MAKQVYWTTKLNDASIRRVEKLESEGIKVDTNTHQGRKVIGYNYLELSNYVTPQEVSQNPSTNSDSVVL
jgi:biotin operon repressor